MKDKINLLLTYLDNRPNRDIFAINFIPTLKEWWVTNTWYDTDEKTGRKRIDGKGKTLEEALDNAIKKL